MQALPPALAGLAQHRQFLLYKIVPGTPKARKIPVHPKTLEATDPHSPASWVTAEEACARATLLGGAYGIAFSIQRANNLFFIDVDNAWDGTAWSPVATDLVNRFPGAAVEVSQSGRGLHILGRGIAPIHACKNIPLGIELYTDVRFIALTGTGVVGNVNSDHTAGLHHATLQYFQPRAGDGIRETDWSEAPVPEWLGPTDDDDLLRRAMQSAGAGSVFGGRAAFADLWQANEGPLAVSYPDPERPYDGSSADLALAQHLAFWTGKDCARIERLMLRSALAREKWERPDRLYETYLRRTITSAVARQTAVLQDKPKEPVAGTEVLPPLPTTAPAPATVAGDTFLGVPAQVELFTGCVYVFEVHRALVPGGHLLNPDRFKVRYGGYSFSMDNRNEKISRDAWEAFTQSQALRAPRADRTCFRPDLAPGEMVYDGSRTLVNLWWPAGVKRTKGDVTPFLRHLEKLFPVELDRRIILSYLAACVQYVGVKFQWCPLIQGVEGNGKSLFSRCVAEAVGQRYTHWVRADRIGGQFNSWLLNKVLACVEDIYVPESKKHLWETLKPMITGEMQEVEPKGVDQDTRNVVINFILNSNHKDAVRKTRNDRRLAIFYTPQQSVEDLARDGMDGAYMPNLYAWLKGGGAWSAHGPNYGYSLVADFLATYPIDPEFDLTGRAPITSSNDAVIQASLGSVEHEVQEALEQRLPGFRNGWISSMALDNLLTRTRMDGRMPRSMRREMLEGMGYFWHPGLQQGRVNNDVMPDAGKPRLFLKPSHLAWDMTGPAEIAKAYTQAQG